MLVVLIKVLIIVLTTLWGGQRNVLRIRKGVQNRSKKKKNGISTSRGKMDGNLGVRNGTQHIAERCVMQDVTYSLIGSNSQFVRLLFVCRVK